MLALKEMTEKKRTEENRKQLPASLLLSINRRRLNFSQEPGAKVENFGVRSDSAWSCDNTCVWSDLVEVGFSGRATSSASGSSSSYAAMEYLSCPVDRWDQELLVVIISGRDESLFVCSLEVWQQPGNRIYFTPLHARSTIRCTVKHHTWNFPCNRSYDTLLKHKHLSLRGEIRVQPSFRVCAPPLFRWKNLPSPQDRKFATLYTWYERVLILSSWLTLHVDPVHTNRMFCHLNWGEGCFLVTL